MIFRCNYRRRFLVGVDSQLLQPADEVALTECVLSMVKRHLHNRLFAMLKKCDNRHAADP